MRIAPGRQKMYHKAEGRRNPFSDRSSEGIYETAAYRAHSHPRRVCGRMNGQTLRPASVRAKCLYDGQTNRPMTRKEELRYKMAEAMDRLGFPEEFAFMIADELGTEYAMERMISWLWQYKPTRPEDAADEMLAIKADIGRFRQKKIAEYYNSKYNQLLNDGLLPEEDSEEDDAGTEEDGAGPDAYGPDRHRNRPMEHKSVSIKAYAKINFILNVKGKRPDGYHEVETFMQALELHDDVQLDWTADDAADGLTIRLEPGRADLPRDERNLAYRAALAFRDAFWPDIKGRLDIRIVKRIPVAAGLAGGSADGAAVLNGLAQLWGLPEGDEAVSSQGSAAWAEESVGRQKAGYGQPAGKPADNGLFTDERVLELAGKLGADLPFCAAAQNGRAAAVGRGTGALLSPAAPVSARIALYKPGFDVPTKQVYAELKPEDYALQADLPGFLSADRLGEQLARLGNHLAAPAMRLYPQIADALERMAAAAPLAVQMSGSGPTVFAVFAPGAPVSGPLPPGAILTDTLAGK